MSHSCLTCRPGADRAVDYERNVVNLPKHFRGPPASGNGGIATGLYACLGAHFLDDKVNQLQVRLHQPIPLVRHLDFSERHLDATSVEIAVSVDSEIILSGWASSNTKASVMDEETIRTLQKHVSLTDEQQHRFDSYEEAKGPSSADFAECFVCGAESQMGLRLRLRPITDEIFWQSWHPESRWEDAGTLAYLPAIAALDCTSAVGFHLAGVLGDHESCLLGTYDAVLASPPAFGAREGFRIVSKTRERVGRKIFTDIGLFSAEGEIHIVGKATWIVVSPEVAKGA